MKKSELRTIIRKQIQEFIINDPEQRIFRKINNTTGEEIDSNENVQELQMDEIIKRIKARLIKEQEKANAS